MFLNPMHPLRERFAKTSDPIRSTEFPIREEDLREGMNVCIEYREPQAVEPMTTLTNLRPFGMNWCYVFSSGLTLGAHYYGRYWRCWLKRPTPQERKAAKWKNDCQ